MNKKPFTINNGAYRAEIEEGIRGAFYVTYYLNDYPKPFDTGRCGYHTLEEAAEAALKQVLEQMAEAQEEER